MITLIVLLVLLALGAASILGWTADSRHPDFTLAPLIGERERV
jgi:hypothetical protein